MLYVVAATATAAGTASYNPTEVSSHSVEAVEILPTQVGSQDFSYTDLLRLEYEFIGPVNVAHTIWLLLEVGHLTELLYPIETALLAFAVGTDAVVVDKAPRGTSRRPK